MAVGALADEILYPVESGTEPAGLVGRWSAHGTGTDDRSCQQGEKSGDDENQADAGNADHGNHLLQQTRLQLGV